MNDFFHDSESQGTGLRTAAPAAPVAATADAVSRRRFVSLVSASAAFALGSAGCSKVDRDKIVPYTKRPQEVIPGVAAYYASTFQEGLVSHGVLVKTREGRPIHLEGFLAAVQHCVGNPETFGQAFDLFGPEPITFHSMLEETARLLGRRARFLAWPGMPRGLFTALLRLVRPSLHPEFLTYLLDQFSGDTPGQGNPVERQIAQGWKPLRETLGASVQAAQKGLAVRPPQRVLDDEVIHQLRRVRSIQRLRLPERRNAEWLAEHYFVWLGTLLGYFIQTERDAEGSWTVRQKPGGFIMLQLTFKPAHSTPDRRMYFITGGALARFLGGRTARLEFRDLLGGRYSMVAIHDFDPSLPWLFYRVTQAFIHGLVMKGFQGHMEQLAEGGPTL